MTDQETPPPKPAESNTAKPDLPDLTFPGFVLCVWCFQAAVCIVICVVTIWIAAMVCVSIKRSWAWPIDRPLKYCLRVANDSPAP